MINVGAEPFDPEKVTWQGCKVTAKDGLLYIGDYAVHLPEADVLAREYGFVYAEQLVKAMGGARK